MGFFKCCKICKPPKRHLGCHGKCTEYAEQKKLQEALNAAIREESRSYHAKTDYLNNPVWRPKKY